MDYPGFGLSEGLHCYIPSFDQLVSDVIEHYSKIKGVICFSNFLLLEVYCCLHYLNMIVYFLVERTEYCSLPSFMFGQSMGGAVALKVHLKQPNAWNGAILVAPMCKVCINVVQSVIYRNLVHDN